MTAYPTSTIGTAFLQISLLIVPVLNYGKYATLNKNIIKTYAKIEKKLRIRSRYNRNTFVMTNILNFIYYVLSIREIGSRANPKEEVVIQ